MEEEYTLKRGGGGKQGEFMSYKFAREEAVIPGA